MSDQIITPNGHQVDVGADKPDGFESFGRSPRGVPGHLMVEAANLLDKALHGNRRARVDVQEAFSSSDFTLAAFAVIDKEVLAQYQEQPSTWRQWCSVTSVRDFRAKKILDMLRGKVGLDQVPELSEYKAIDRTGNETGQVQVGKYGNRYAVSWEAWINDEAIDEIGDIPQWFSQAAAETEAIMATKNLVTSTGINTSFFKSANGNTPDSGKPPLTLANLDAAIQTVQKRKNSKGRPVFLPNMRLVVPPALSTQADRILGAREIRTTDGDTEIVSDNYLSGSVVKVVEPMLEVVNQGSNAATTWFLLPDPGSARRSVYVAFLRGHEAPEIRVKADTGNRVGGGQIAPEEGSFDIDDIQYRVRHVVGNGTGDGLPTYASDGSGS